MSLQLDCHLHKLMDSSCSCTVVSAVTTHRVTGTHALNIYLLRIKEMLNICPTLGGKRGVSFMRPNTGLRPEDTKMETNHPASHLQSSEDDNLQEPSTRLDVTHLPPPSSPTTHHALLQRLFDASSICHWEPDLSDDALLGDINIAHVQDVVNGLHLLHLGDPGVPVGSCFLQQALAVRFCLCDDLGKRQHAERRGTWGR